MSISFIISIVLTVLIARFLLKGYNAQATLLIGGLVMLLIAWILGRPFPELKEATGTRGFDLFQYVRESFAGTNASVGLMIMAIGGFVAYVDKLGASEALVNQAMKPLSLLKKHPHLTASFVIPLGQLLFVCIPSAAGLAILLMATVYPILVGLGVSRLSAASVITATTAFGVGPASAITASASSISEMPALNYFIQYQLPILGPLNLILMVAFYFTNRYYDKKLEPETLASPETVEDKEQRSTPKIYAVLPIVPLILLIVFSDLWDYLPVKIHLDTTTAMFISLFVALIFELVRTRNIKEVFQGMNIFWGGMASFFKSIVTLIIAADVFSQGLISLGFIDGLVDGSSHLGFGPVGIGIVMAVLIFFASMLMGSGNASFFAFGPLVPEIAAKFGVETTRLVIPMNMAASMGRTVSPVAGVLIAVADIAKVTTLQIVKRNLIPLGSALLFLIIYFTF